MAAEESQLPIISIVQRDVAREGRHLSSGYNSRVLMNGEELRGVNKVTITLEAGKLATAEVTLIGQIEVIDLPVQVEGKTKQKIDGCETIEELFVKHKIPPEAMPQDPRVLKVMAMIRAAQ